MSSLCSRLILAAGPQISFPQGAVVNEQIALRWMHLVAGIIWIGLLYFFNLVGTPTLKGLEAPVRAKIFPALMSRAMWWFRWSALVTVIAGLRYFWMILSADAHNAGDPALAWKWMGLWLVVWLVAFALIYPFQLPHKGILDSVWVRVIAIASIAIRCVVGCARAECESTVVEWASGDQHRRRNGSADAAERVGNHLARAEATDRVDASGAEQGTPMPPEAAYFARWAFLASRTGFWMSLPMLFFMAAAGHYPFLGGITN